MTTEVETSAAPAEGEVLPEEVQTVAQDVESTPTEPQDDSADDAAAEAKRHKGGFQKRIDELTRRVAEERREKERLLSLVETTVRPSQREAEPAPNTPQEPKREAFDDYEAYLDARAEWKAEMRLSARMQEIEANRQQEAARTQRESLVSEWDRKMQRAAEKNPEIHPDMPVPRMPATMSQAIVESDVGPEIVFHLAHNPAEAARIAALSPLSQARELGKLELQLATKPVKASNAPEPIKPVGARSTGSDPLSDRLSMDQWAKNFEKEFYKGRR